jgi:ferredoxin
MSDLIERLENPCSCQRCGDCREKCREAAQDLRDKEAEIERLRAFMEFLVEEAEHYCEQN